MARIAFILLCHKNPDAVIAQARRVTAAGDYIAIHMDAKARRQDFARLQQELGGDPNVAIVRRRVRCAWGEWSLVQATLNALETALAAFPKASHAFMLSGDCLPIKPARVIHEFLSRNDADFIENYDFFTSTWIKVGLRDERLIYRHFFNERGQKALFYGAIELQRKLGLARRLPDGLRFMIGSQWWCLRRTTVEKVLAFCRSRPDIPRFFRRTWIPDETFFQTLVPHLIPRSQIRCRTLTFLIFSDYGIPAVFHDDHLDLLMAQDHLFARKISPEARGLKEKLAALYLAETHQAPARGDGHALHGFLTGRGRVGRRHGRRIWDEGAGPPRGAELLVIVAEDQPRAARLAADAGAVAGVPAFGYVWSDPDCPLPDLGGLETTVDKRGRHVNAFLRVLFEVAGGERLIFCVTPDMVWLLRDLADHGWRVRILRLSGGVDALADATRQGLLATDDAAAAELLPVLDRARQDREAEIAAVAPDMLVLTPADRPLDVALTLGAFLDAEPTVAASLADRFRKEA
ncbi:DUF5928 domain-containing protein [Halodurantibacterium flavum]|uniref:Peptide O-xylosyltransferase n=1 Tax=Halodurantibacterium flavum TaxID=1382802 RepID=A0ABW4S2F9_9RHOB